MAGGGKDLILEGQSQDNTGDPFEKRRAYHREYYLAHADEQKTTANARYAAKRLTSLRRSPRKAQSRAGTSKHSSGAAFALELRTWWAKGDHSWQMQKEMAKSLGIRPASLCAYFAGRTFPSKQNCAKLFKATELACFGPHMVESRVFHVQLCRLRSAWCRNFLIDLHGAINSHTDSPRTREGLRASTFAIVRGAEARDLTSRNEITPQWLRDVSAGPDHKRSTWAKGFVARFLHAQGLWTPGQLKTFNDVSRSAAANNRLLAAVSQHQHELPRRAHKPTPPKELCELVWELIYRCGVPISRLSMIRLRHVSDMGVLIPESDPRQRFRKDKQGIRKPVVNPHLQQARLIQFGDGWDQLKREKLDTYLHAARPEDHLFYKLHPRDKHLPLSRQTIIAAIHARDSNGLAVSLTQKGNRRKKRSRTHKKTDSFGEVHFQEDFRRAKDLRDLRFHFINVHGLSGSYAHRLVQRFLSDATTFPIPLPFLLAALCASRLLPGDLRISEGGKRATLKWANVAGYDVVVDSPVNLARKLSHRQMATGLFRNILRAACELAQVDNLRPKRITSAPRKRGRTDSKGRTQNEIENWLAQTTVEITDTGSGAAWSGALFELRNRRRLFAVPLLENMVAGQWRPRCEVCGHHKRGEIERRIANVASRPQRVKGWKSLAKEYGVSYGSILLHAGRKGQRAHMASAVSAPVVSCPRDLLERIARVRSTSLVDEIVAACSKRA
jgi:hypothetical protein